MKQSIDFDAIGDKHKALESIQAGVRLIPGIPVIARLDGRAFHTFTRHAVKPFDNALIVCMQNTAKDLLDKFQADLAYCQSDEITLVWKNLDSFSLKVQKICSLLAAQGTATFNAEVVKNGFESKTECLPIFDCRVWQVPNLEIAAENVLWRQWDAFKNSVSMAAHSMFSTKELHKKNTRDKITMMEEKGFIWGNLPSSHKGGTFFRKEELLKELTPEELENIPEKFRPTTPILRNVVLQFEVPRLTSVCNKSGVLFEFERPVYFGDMNDPDYRNSQA